MTTDQPGTTPTLVPALDVPEELRADISTTFTFGCPWGCTVHVVESEEQPHVCVGEQVIGALVPDLTVAEMKTVADGLKPLVRELLGQSWEDGVRSGRLGPCAGVDDPSDVRGEPLPPGPYTKPPAGLPDYVVTGRIATSLTGPARVINADGTMTFVPDGHVDDVGCPCGPIVDPVAGLMHGTLVGEAGGSDV